MFFVIDVLQNLWTITGAHQDLLVFIANAHTVVLPGG